MVAPSHLVAKGACDMRDSNSPPLIGVAHVCCGMQKLHSDSVCQFGAGRVGSCHSMLSSWSPFPALSIRSVWGLNPRPLINDAAVVVGSIPSFLWSHDDQIL